MEIGKLYKCSEYYLLIYPSIEKVGTARDASVSAWAWAGATSWIGAAAVVNYWSKQLNCKVRFSEPEEVFMALEQEKQFVHALFREKQGWIVNKEWLKIERVE